jgi:hypothetical protein
LVKFKLPNHYWKTLSEASEGLSYADITRATEDAIKETIISDRESLTIDDLLIPIGERISLRDRLMNNK